MRSGRPAYHIKAHFVSFFDANKHTFVYFELDNKGNLKKNENGQFSSHIENSYMQNSNLIVKPKESPIVAKPANIKTDVKSLNKEVDNFIEESLPNDSLEGNFNDNSFDSFDDYDMFNSFPINDIFFQDDNIFNFSEDQPLNII